MLPVLLKDIKSFLHLEVVATDNGVFRLHYKATVLLLCACSLLLGAKQYFGDPIDCHVDGVPNNIMDTYCWVHGTYTVREWTADIHRDEAPHPGIGYYDDRVHEKIYHRYYQWVPLVLAVTAVFFYLPRFVWKQFECGLMAHACKDMRLPSLDEDEPDKPTAEQRRATKLFHFYTGNHLRNQLYTFKFFTCELMNLINIAAQLALTDVFLNGAFSVYGHEFLHYFELDRSMSFKRLLLDSSAEEEHANPAELVFPKVTTCTFAQHGPSGNVQKFHGLCVLPLNVLNEKIYYVIWFWYVFLVVVTAVGMVYRILVITCSPVRRWVLFSRMGPYDYREVSFICAHCSIGDWFILRQISKNVDGQTFATFVNMLRNYYDREAHEKRREAARSRSKSRMEKLLLGNSKSPSSETLDRGA